MNLEDTGHRTTTDIGSESRSFVLSEKVAEATKALKDGSVGSLHAARIIVPLGDVWDKTYREETGLDWSTWVTKTFETGSVARFQGLYEAYSRCRPHWRGNGLLTKFHQDTIRYIGGDTVPGAKRKECLQAVGSETKRLPLSYQKARKIVAKVLGKTSTPRGIGQEEREAVRAYCAELAKEITQLGGVLPEVPALIQWVK